MSWRKSKDAELKNKLNLSAQELDFIFSPEAIRAQAKNIFDRTVKGQTHFVYHPDKLNSTVEFVLKVIKKKYPDLNIPFHSRWGHFRAAGIDRTIGLDKKLSSMDAFEKARVKLDLVVTSVLLDAGAGAEWSYQDQESAQAIGRSEGLGVASFHMFLAGAMANDKKSLKADSEGLKKVSADDLKKAFQVSAQNPLVGVEGRVLLLNNLGKAMENKKIFKDGRPGNILDYLTNNGTKKEISAVQILKAVLEGFGSIWPGRLSSGETNLGDVWFYDSELVPFHKLSQWMTYSLIEPIVEAGVRVKDVEKLTGLAEYRNGGLILDSGLVTLKNPEDEKKSWKPDSNLIIEWRGLTVYLLDRMGEMVQKSLHKSPAEFPLAKVLEGGTWWAGRELAAEKRKGATPPLSIDSDGTVF